MEEERGSDNESPGLKGDEPVKVGLKEGESGYINLSMTPVSEGANCVCLHVFRYNSDCKEVWRLSKM